MEPAPLWRVDNGVAISFGVYWGKTNACKCTGHLSRRYSHSLSDQSVAARRPRQANRACHRDHPRRDFAAQIYRGVLSARVFEPRDAAGCSIPALPSRFWSMKKPRQTPGLLAYTGVVRRRSFQRLEPVVHVSLNLVLGEAVALLQLALELLA